MKNQLEKISRIIKDNFRYSTLSFLFIIAYETVFQSIFGAENTIVGIIFTILMAASMVRDMTATPLRNLIGQSFVLVWMGVAAYLVNVLPAPLSFLINFITLLLILYAFTYEYASHRYFPYILSYLFLIFISPVTEADRLPMRLLGLVFGAASIILYQWFMGRKRVSETARDVLTEMIDDICRFITHLLDHNAEKPDLTDTRNKLCRLSKIVYDRRKKVLCVSDAGFSMIAAGRGLEQLLILLHRLPENLSEREKLLLPHVTEQLKTFRAFLQQEITVLPENNSELFSQTLVYIRDRLLHMSDPQGRTHYRKTALSLKIQLQAALDLSPVRAIYALRTALLLSCATLLVQLLALPHGKWLVFTFASVSLPYANDVPVKIRKRVLATLIGGLFSVLLFMLVPSSAGRTAIMMLSGYLSFYFSDYLGTFACSTIGALGGAIFMSAFSLRDITGMFLIRTAYIIAGVMIAYIVNCLFFPYSRAKATEQLWKKYKSITELLTKVCASDQGDPQLYYSLVIQAHMLEEKLTQNADKEDWEGLPALLIQCREQVRQAHRKHVTGRADAPVFESGHPA